MTVATLVSSDSWVSAGTLAPRSIPFPFINLDDLVATYTPVSGAVQALVRGTHYTITGNNRAGTAVFTPLVTFAAGGTFRTERVTRPLQEYETERSTPLDADSVERELDRQAMRNLEQDRDAAALAVRTPLALPGQTAPAFDVAGLGEGDLLEYRGGQLRRFDAAPFAGKFYGGAAVTGRPVPLPGIGGADAGLREALASLAGALLMGTDDGRTVQARIDELKNGTAPVVAVGSASLSVAEHLANTGVRPEHALSTGESISVDAGPAIRRILAAGRPLILSRNTEYVVGFDPASAFDDGGTTRYSACISLGSNAHILAEAGSTIKGANGLQSWTRIVSAVGANKIVILGVLRVDGNVANKGAAHNEHMHGVFLFDCTEFYIEAIDSRNTRGDNVYIGGTDNSTGCANSFIGRIIGRTAGRKNLACQAFNACHIGSADLDNTSGGIGAYMPAPSVGLSVPKSAGVYASDTGFPMLNTTGAAIVLTGTSQASLAGQGFIVDQTDKHCLDVEPDAFSGATRNQMRIDYVRARGSGVDFTAGTTFTQANAMVVNFGEIDMAVVPSPGVPVWVQNAITINVGVLSINGLTPTCPTSPIYYAARLNVGRMVVNGASPPGGYAFLVSQVGNNVPRIEIGTIDGVITGSGFEVRDSDFEIGNCRVTCSAVTLWARGLSSTAGVEVRCIIKRLELDNSGDPAGANYAGLLTKSGSNIARLDIDHVVFRDSRATKLARIIYCQTGAARGLSIGRQDNETTVATVAWEGTDKFYRTNGGGTAPATFVCNGTPEGMVAAPIGSLAYRNDGGASTSIYVKESGTGNTGWVAK